MKNDKFFKIITPEEGGISSGDIEKMINVIEKRGICLHSYLILKGDSIVSEGYYPPFDEKYKHRMYSVSKSFVGTAVGALIDEGKLSLDDKVHTFFPDKIPPEGLHKYVENTTIRDLLTMCSPFETDAYAPCTANMDWAWTFFNTKPNHPSGTVFKYDTCGTYMLDVIVERITGKPYMTYLYERVLKYLGFSEDTWCVKSPEGYSWGGSGVMATLRDLARLGYLYMRKGNINGKQILSEKYANDAVSRLVNPANGCSASPYSKGYGYQIWCTDEGFAFIGMGGQLCFAFPEKDIIFCVNGDNQGNAAAYHVIYHTFEDYVLNKLSDNPLPENKKAYESLLTKINNLKLPVPNGITYSHLADKINGKWIKCDRNPMGISKYKLVFQEDEGVFIYDTVRGVKQIKFGLGKHIISTFPEKHYFAEQINVPSGRELRCTAAANWYCEDELTLRCYIIDTCFGNCTISFGFNEDRVSLIMNKTAEWFMNEYQGVAGGYIC